MKRIQIWQGILMALILIMLVPLSGKAQDNQVIPKGSQTLFCGEVHGKNGDNYYAAIYRHGISVVKLDSTNKKGIPGLAYYKANCFKTDVVTYDLKIVQDTAVFILLLSNGNVFSFNPQRKVTGNNIFTTTKYISNVGYKPDSTNDAYVKIVGDDLYALSNTTLFVSRNTAISWSADSAGLNGATINDVSVDSGQNVYIATNMGLFKQAPSGSSWTNIKSPYLQSSHVFGAHNGTLFLSSFSSLSSSIDNGKSWKTDTTGLHGAAAIKFCEDSAGNVYAITAQYSFLTVGDGLFKHASKGWTNIGKNFLKMNADPTNSNIFNSINGGSTLYLSTNFGSFISTDAGTTWTVDPNAALADNIFGMAVTSKGTKVMSTAMGVYYKTSGSTSWTHSFPSSGYVTGQKIFKDKNDVLYTLGKIKGNNTYSLYPREMWKSTDEGKTWTADTLDMSKVRAYYYFVDENGNEYAGAGATANFIKRVGAGNSWEYDTQGFLRDKNYTGILGYGSDGTGTVYASAAITGKAYVYRRDVNSTTWLIDSAGWDPSFSAFSFANDASGNIFAGAMNGGVLKRVNGRWKRLQYPNANLFGNSVFTLTTDNSGALFVAYSNFTYAATTGLGVFMTKDTGSNWTQVGTDSFNFNQLVSAGDTIYGLANYGGVYAFTESSSVTAVEEQKNILNANGIKIYPNPAKDELTISFSKDINDGHFIEITDMQGRRMRSYTFKENVHDLQMDLTNLPRGIYILSVQTSSGVERQKFIRE